MRMQKLTCGLLSWVALCWVANLVQISHSVAPTSSAFFENFDTDWKGRWIPSADPKYTGSWEWDASSVLAPAEDDQGLLLVNAAQHSAISKQLDPPVKAPEGKPFVFQYEVKLQDTLQCGGAYVKLLSEEGGAEPSGFNDKSPYVIMFGPDRCGMNDRVHFIVRHQNPKSKEWEEKHLDSAPNTESGNRRTHLYTLVINPDSTFEILVDLKSVKTGSLLDDFTPPFNPPKEIDDPEDKKPEDWVDQAKIPDPNAEKPEDWDESQPAKIPNPKATKPADWKDDEPKTIPDPSQLDAPEEWDEEEDGKWEPPEIPNPACGKNGDGCGEWKPDMIANPLFKGKWSAPLIKNPEYKGEWKPRKIANPHYFEDNEPAKSLPAIRSIGLEIWTMQGNILFDNFVIGFDKQAALDYGKATWQPKYNEETDMDPDAQDEAGIMEKIQEFFATGGTPVYATLIVGVVSVAGGLYVLCGGGAKKQPEPAWKSYGPGAESSSDDGGGASSGDESSDSEPSRPKSPVSPGSKKPDTKKRLPKAE
eukprot:TRINITY_DN54698_c0_g1_i1.p1 TRINITY_DN54698_c0_g1~~TRINITY_DN54698_c0_g1_i1.p1  ORF type:complete len:532 (-),score=93.77 TRINITY_DN54698_c0_g1_i1:1535-3130(-)